MCNNIAAHVQVSPAVNTASVKSAIEEWLAARNWKAFKFQKDVWKAVERGESGLLHATTGSGKTYAVWLGVCSVLWL